MHIVAFGPFQLDTKRRVLLANGLPVDLQARPLDILAFLVSNADRVVTRDEILAHVWQGLVVAENNLTVQMSILRRCLADHGADGLILTIAGRGYRFVGDLRVAEAPSSPHPMQPAGQQAGPGPVPASLWRRRAGAAGGLLALALAATAVWLVYFHTPAPPRLSIAVLPFRNLSNDRNQDYLADVISDDITTDLAHIPGSTVIARESADSYRGRAVPTAQIGRSLNVRYLLEGSLSVEDGDFHVNAQLIEAATGGHLWAERFNEPQGHLAEARTAIVRRIASALDAELTDIEGARSLHDRPDDPDAISLFYRARAITEHDDSQAGFTRAQHLLEQAIKQQPDFADALAQLGLTLILKVRSSDDPADQQDLAEARQVVAHALRVGPHNATALAADARLRLTDGQCAPATYSARAALAAEPNSIDALAVLATCALRSGDLQEASDREEEVLRLNPENRMNKPRYVLLSETRLLQGRYKDAIDFANQALAGDPDPAPGDDDMGRPEFCRLILIAAYVLNGDAGHAHDLYVAYRKIWPNRSVWRIAAYATHHQAALPGYAAFKAALHTAGMPLFADEHADNHVPAPTTPALCRDFDATPTVLPGGGTIDTKQLANMLKPSLIPPLIIDIGSGAAVIPGAAWLDSNATLEDDTAFMDRILAARGQGGLDSPIVVMADGTYGYEAYNGALHLLSLGYRHVLWYRGGEEAWSAAGLPAVDRRSQ